jgi:hypothetical protein
MKVGFIGAGTVTGTIGRHLITAGHTIVVSNSRGPETLTDFVADLGPNASDSSPLTSGPSKRVAPCTRLALHYPGSIFTSSGGFVESARMPERQLSGSSPVEHQGT